MRSTEVARRRAARWESLQRDVAHPLAWILLAALLVRVVFFLQTRGDPTFNVPLWDAAVFDEMARSVARGDGIGTSRAYFFGPLYAYLLGLVYAVSGSSPGFAVLLQHLVGVGLVGLTYLVARGWFGRTESLLAAALLAFTPLGVFYEGKLLMETWLSLFLLLQVFLLQRLSGSTRGREAAPGRERGDATTSGFRRDRLMCLLAGLLLGLAALGRPSVLLLAALGVWAVWSPRTRRTPPSGVAGRGRLRTLRVAAYMAGLLLPLLATTVRNHRVEGVFVPITSSGGFNFYLGNSPDTQETFLEDLRVRTDSSWNGESTAETALGRQLDSAELSRYWFRRTFDEIAVRPGPWLGLCGEKLWKFWNAVDVPQIESFEHERAGSPVLRFLPFGMHLLIATAIAGMIAGLPRRRELGLLFGTALIYSLAIALFFVTTRYRVAALPCLAILAGAFVGQFGRALRGRRWPAVAPLALAFLAAWAFASPDRFPQDERKQEYVHLLHDGFRLARAERYEDALQAYRRAQALWPEDYESHLGMGITYREMGDFESSLRELEAAEHRNQVDAEVPYHLGITLHKMGRGDAAESALRGSLALDPRRALTRAHLGVVLAVGGRMVEAKRELEAAVELDPEEPFAVLNLAVLRGLEGDHEAARRGLLEALRLDPDYVQARWNLAQFHLESGDPASAKAELRRLLSIAPGDSAARQLLRRIERGEREEPRDRPPGSPPRTPEGGQH